MAENLLNLSLRRTISILIWAFAVYAQTSFAQDAAHDIEDVERKWNAAIARGDQSTYDELLTDDFSWTFVSGRVINRQQMIETIGPVEIKERDKTIRAYENTAVVMGVASLTVGGRPLTERFVRVWVKGTDGSWQLAYFQATEIE